MNTTKEIEALMASELNEIEAGSAANQGICACETGAGEVVIVIEDPTDPSLPRREWEA